MKSKKYEALLLAEELLGDIELNRIEAINVSRGDRVWRQGLTFNKQDKSDWRLKALGSPTIS